MYTYIYIHVQALCVGVGVCWTSYIEDEEIHRYNVRDRVIVCFVYGEHTYYLLHFFISISRFAVECLPADKP